MRLFLGLLFAISAVAKEGGNPGRGSGANADPADTEDYDADQARHWAEKDSASGNEDSDSVLVLLKPGLRESSCGFLKGQSSFLQASSRGMLKVSVPDLISRRNAKGLGLGRSRNPNPTRAELIQEVSDDCLDDIESIVPDSVIYTNGRPLRSDAGPSGRRLLQTSDTYIAQQWGLKAINAFTAWGQGAMGTDTQPVCVVDTGIQVSHTDLLKNILRNPLESSNSIDDDGNGYVDDILGARQMQMATLKKDGTCGDDNGHGTHVGGIIGAIANNSAGVAGVAPRTKLIICKAMNSTGAGFLSDITACFDYCVSRGARIVNSSFGSCSFTQYWLDFMRNVFNSYSNVLFVSAAGNKNQFLDVSPTCGFPAIVDSPNVISVGAIGTNFLRASFSNYGQLSVDVGAPGVNIYSTYTGSSYAILQGTSMATGFVSGAAALLLGANSTLTATDMKAALMNTCNTTYSSGTPWNGCNGFIDVAAALKYIRA